MDSRHCQSCQGSWTLRSIQVKATKLGRILKIVYCVTQSMIKEIILQRRRSAAGAWCNISDYRLNRHKWKNPFLTFG